MAASLASPLISSEQMAEQLMKCAILVKKGETSSPLLRQTIQDLTEYLDASASAAPAVTPVDASRPSSPKNSPGTATPVISNTSSSSLASARKEPVSTLAQPLKPQFGQVFSHIIGTAPINSPKTDAQKSATSAKNAQRLKADLMDASKQEKPSNGIASWLHHDESEWCEVHFTMGCGCQKRRTEETTATKSMAANQQNSSTTLPTTQGVSTAATQRLKSKPAFTRPVNSKSAVIANGWIEQQRRSKMRIVWKDVLASVVEGRKPGEETTLWIQRELVNPSSGIVELEALHQIPVKWIEDVSYLQYSTDSRFSVKVYNLGEEFVFRCARDDEAAQSWVLTLRSLKLISQQKHQQRKANSNVSAGSAGSFDSSQQEEKKAELVNQNGRPQQQNHRMTVTELRAIAHGAGINTHGMERGELEAIVIRIAQNRGGNAESTASPQNAARGVSSSPPVSQTDLGAQDTVKTAEAANTVSTSGVSAQAERDLEVERLRRMEEIRRQQQIDEEAAAKRRLEEEEKRRLDEEEQRRLMAERVREQQVAEQKRNEEEERLRLAEERRKRDEEEIRRRLAEKQAADLKQKQEEAQRLQQQQWQQQQLNWQKQQADEEQRRRLSEQQAAEERRRQEEAYRLYQQQHAQWQAQQQQRPQQPGVPPSQQFTQAQWQQHNATHGHQPFFPSQQRPPSQPNVAPPGGPLPHPQQQQQFPQQQWQQQPQQQPPQSSPINLKYAKMAQQQEEDGSLRTMTQVKQGILIQWALQPPMLQVLRPVDELITSIHKVFPPAFGVPAHDYFTKWTAVSVDELSNGASLGNGSDEGKVKRSLRKLRFFLHPDKLPRDLNKEQFFVCKMLWDIINDAEDEFKKKEEDLGWIRK